MKNSVAVPALARLEDVPSGQLPDNVIDIRTRRRPAGLVLPDLKPRSKNLQLVDLSPSQLPAA